MSGASRGLTRRGILALTGATALSMAIPPWAWAQGRTGLHGLSIFGDLKYPASFTHFDYVNPTAPKGGRMNFQPPNWILNQSPQTFNTLNGWVLKGDAPPRIELLFDTLLSYSPDTPDDAYGALAESIDVNDDASVFTFHLRSAARFHDGTPLTADDVAFSIALLRDEGHPNLAGPLKPVTNVEAPDAATVVVTLDDTRTPDTILSVAALPIFSKAFYTANTFDAASMTPPLGSGPYKVGRFAPGRYIEYERVADYWGNDLPVNIGFANFDIIRIDFFTERQAAFEAFKKGEITYREEATSITWAQDYNFPAVQDGRVKKTTEFESEKRPSYQGMMFNTRRAKFRDPRARLAISMAFDFEWSNPNLFFDAYERISSIFGKSEYAASGVPSAAELAILEPFRAELPPEVFGEPYQPPKTDGSGRDRAVLRRASELLTEAGFKRMGNTLVDEEGAPIEIEILIDAQVFERVMAPWVKNLKDLGIDAFIRQVDPAQYQSRMNVFDFDIILEAMLFSSTPLDGLQQFFSTASADQNGSYNTPGVKEPAIDAALAKLSSVKTREDLIAITRAIDRVFTWRHYWNPGWRLPNHRTAFWDIFGYPETKPDYAFKPETTWWFDSDRAKAIGYTG